MPEIQSTGIDPYKPIDMLSALSGAQHILNV